MVRAIDGATDQARAYHEDRVRPEHLLLGLLDQEYGVAVQVLGELGVSVAGLRNDIQATIQSADRSITEPILFSDEASAVLALSKDEASSLGHHLLGTEHLLLGLIREGNSEAARLLTAAGVELGSVRGLIVEVLNRYSHGRTARLVEGNIVDRNISHPVEVGPEQAELNERLLETRDAKAAAIENQDFDRAAHLRDREKEILVRLAELRRRIG